MITVASLTLLVLVGTACARETSETYAAFTGAPFEQHFEEFTETHNLTKDTMRHHAGECAVGVSCGFLAGWLVRKLQGAAMTASVVGAISAVAALHLEWLNPDQVPPRGRPTPALCTLFAQPLHLLLASQLQLLVITGFRWAKRRVQSVLMLADVDRDGELTIEGAPRRPADAAAAGRPTPTRRPVPLRADSKIAYSRVAPHAKKHPALASGLVGGFVAAYGQTR